MSIQAINWALEQPGSPTQKHVLLVLANYATKNGYAFPSNRLLAARTGLNEKTIRRAKSALIQAGLIELSGHVHTRSFRLCLDITLSPKDTDASKKIDPPAHNMHTASQKKTLDTMPPPSDIRAQQKATKSTLYNHQLTTNHPCTSHPSSTERSSMFSSAEEFPLPDWVPHQTWKAWLEMRRAQKKPATHRVVQNSLKKLDTLRRRGQNPRDVLENCLRHGWRGIYPISSSQPSNIAPSPPSHRRPCNPFSGFGDEFDGDILELTPEQKALYFRYGGHA